VEEVAERPNHMMPKKNNRRMYEAMFLMDSGEAAVWEDLSKYLNALLDRHGAEILGLTRWDERKPAYTVGKCKRGTYVLAFFGLGDGSAVVEIERDCQLSEKIARVLVLKADHYKISDMRTQLGEDVRPEVARKLMDERGEKEPLEVPSPAAAAPAAAAPAATAPAAEPVQPSKAAPQNTSDREVTHGEL